MKILPIDINPSLPMLAVYRMARGLGCVLTYHEGKVRLARRLPCTATQK
jgi:hypothetical protein